MSKRERSEYETEILKFVGRRVQSAREAARYERNELAEKLGMGGKNPGHQIYLIEEGIQGMSLKRLWTICDILGIRPADLLDDTVVFATPGRVAEG